MVTPQDVSELNKQITAANKRIGANRAERKVHIANLNKAVEDLVSQGYKIDTSSLESIHRDLTKIRAQEMKKVEASVSKSRSLLDAFNKGDYHGMRRIMGIASDASVDEDEDNDLVEQHYSDYDDADVVDAEGSDSGSEGSEGGAEPIQSVFGDFDDGDDEDEPTAAPAQSLTKKAQSLFDEEDDDEEPPAPAKPKAKSPAKKAPVSQFDIDDDEDDSSVTVTPRTATAQPFVYDDDEDDNDGMSFGNLVGSKFTPKNK